MAQMQQYIIFLSLKPIKVSSDFILIYLKKSFKGRHHSEISKTKNMISSLWMRGARGVNKNGSTKEYIT